MDRKEFYAKIKELVSTGSLYLFSDYKVGDEYLIELRGNIVYVTLGNNDEHISHKKDYIFTKKIFEGQVQDVPQINELGLNDSLELLYHHYPYGVDNSSNSVLINNDEKIIGIQWNGLKSYSVLRSRCQSPGYIVLNNKKKCIGDYTLKDLDFLTLVCTKIFPN